MPAGHLVDQVLNRFFCCPRLGLPGLDLLDALFHQQSPFEILFEEFPKFLDQDLEEIGIVGEVVEYPQHDRFDEVVQRVSFELGRGAPTDPRARKLVQELTCRMV